MYTVSGDPDGNETVDVPIGIGDNKLVAWMSAQASWREIRSDVDNSGSPPIDVADLVYLVDHQFTGGPAPPPCP